MTSQTTLTKTRLFAGQWEGVLSVPDGAPAPQIEVVVHDERIDDVAVAKMEAPGDWAVTVPIPPEVLSDGVQIFLIRDRATDAVLNSFVVMAGEEVSDTVQAEILLLRAELDMLKRAFRRHCVETGAA
ncbi:hypothetical protein [Pseudooceanicola marinus]|uniref:hypothetical protein n=1 Tax=Pseudooceanicola marinus TaxID=396013 RepID=UPI001CD783DB|nr:hypothetical protein [Pseudooceanicola marinus]MCA1335767.1 hypothetical protein [Pseudooceanicola marinus]